MENSSTSSSSRFRFRDQPDVASDVSSVRSDLDNQLEFQSMTSKGIKHLCSELAELKQESDRDFHRNIFFNYAAFVRIFDEVETMENQLITLKSQIVVHQEHVKGLTDGSYLKALPEGSMESNVEEEFSTNELLGDHQMGLEVHINNMSETFEILLVENRTEEAINILEMEEEKFQRLQLDDSIPLDVLVQYKAVLSEKKAMLTLQLTLQAENPRINAAELQKTLLALCRLSEDHLATQLLIKYYHLRIVTGIHNLQSSSLYVHAIYGRELPKLVFSLVSQAAKSYAMLYGENSDYAPELIQWAKEETEVFVAYFSKYIKLIWEISDGLPTVVQSVQFAMSYCSLLETQRLMLLSCLVKHMRPCVEEIFWLHIGHYKKVIGMFTGNDAWILGRYLVSGILSEGEISMNLGQQSEYCRLTDSGRKLITLLQTIAVDVGPLVSLQMEESVAKGFMDLFTEYIFILETTINLKTEVAQKGYSIMELSESVLPQVSLLANLSTLELFIFNMVRSILGETFGQRELNDYKQSIQNANIRLRAHFCQQVFNRMMFLKNEHASETCINVGSKTLQDVMPSIAFQVLFLELSTLHKAAEENVLESDWLMLLLHELIEFIFVCISENKQIWTVNEDNLISSTDSASVYNQFVLDIHFLVEITKYGGYFSNNPSNLEILLNSVLNSVGQSPERNVNDAGWAYEAANEAIKKLLQIQKTKSQSNEELIDSKEQQNVISISDNSTASGDDQEITGEAESTSVSHAMITPQRQLSSLSDFFDFLEVPDSEPTGSGGNLEDIEFERVAFSDLHLTEKINSNGWIRSSDNVDAANKLEDDTELESSTSEVTHTQDFVNPDQVNRIIE